MDKLEEKLREILWICRKNPQYVKIAVIALVVITALVFFGTKGEKEEIAVIQERENIVEEESDLPAQDAAATFVVDLDGCVKSPGIYEVTEGTRLYQVIEMAGGLTKDADTTQINQAEELYDGQKILIPQFVDEENLSSEQKKNSAASITNGKININTADGEALQEIPGVGPATAEKIITYRESNGKFKYIEDLKNVSGIGEKTFEKMKDRITI